MFLTFWNDERASTTLENMLWIALFVLGVAGIASGLLQATSNLASRMTSEIDSAN